MAFGLAGEAQGKRRVQGFASLLGLYGPDT